MPDDSEELDLWKAYRATTYQILRDDDPPLAVRIDHPAPLAGPMAYVTADNPGSRRLSEAKNTQRRSALLGELAATDFEVFPGESIADNGDWPVEQGLWIQGISKDQARTLARRFAQNAIVFIDDQRQVHLVDCRP